jgi:PilZ domain
MAAKHKQQTQGLTALASRLDTRKREPAKTEGVKSGLRESGVDNAKAVKPKAEPATQRLGASTNRSLVPVKSVSPSPLARPSVRTSLPVIPKSKTPVVGVSSVALEKKPETKSSTKRSYPRVGMSVRASLALAEDPTKVFEASLPTVNVSVGGLFLESSFFLKLGTKLLVSLAIPPENRVVRAKGQVVRVDSSDRGKTGFAIRFTEYLDGSEVVLATNFLSPVLREFLQQYASVHQFTADEHYLRHLTDVLAAWELKKANLGDIWES